MEGSTQRRAHLSAVAAALWLVASHAGAQWFGTKTGPISRLYVLAKVDDALTIDGAEKRRDERRWAEFIVREAVAKLRDKYPRAAVGGGVQVTRTQGPLFDPDPIIGVPMPTGKYHMVRIAVQTCGVSSWFGRSDMGFCWNASLHRFTPTNEVLAEKEGKVAGTDIGGVLSAVSKFIGDFRE